MMKEELRFYCKKCDMHFKAQPLVEEYDDLVEGKCERIYALCPACNIECSEYKKKIYL